jgi:ATP-binding cassette subfamily B protein
LELELKKIVLVRKMSFIQGTAINAFRSLLLLLMLWLISQGQVSLGQFFSLLIYSFYIFSPLGELGVVATQLQESRASMGRLDEVLQTKSEVKPEHAIAIGKLHSIEFKNLTFAYNSSTHVALKNVNVKINAGETVAFVGPSGSGKTTLVKLISGLYAPTSGSLFFNKTERSFVHIDDFRKRVGLVAQETQLFAGTIRENLLFVNPSATDQECLAVLEAAAASSLLQRALLGLETKIGEGGIKLSGGERQRLAIARALLRRPELIIFDEATSSLDSITEKSITETIRNIEKKHPDLMTILVAHRLSTIAHADRIYVLEKGSVIEQGTHKELLARKGLYAALWRQQIAVDNE